MSITNTTAGADLAEIDEGLQHVEQHTEPDEQDGHDAADADSAPVAKDTAATATGARRVRHARRRAHPSALPDRPPATSTPPPW